MSAEKCPQYRYVECPWENNGRIEILYRPILRVYLHNPDYPKEHPFPVYGLVAVEQTFAYSPAGSVKH